MKDKRIGMSWHFKLSQIASQDYIFCYKTCSDNYSGGSNMLVKLIVLKLSLI